MYSKSNEGDWHTVILGHFNPQHLREWEEQHLILLNRLQAHYRRVYDVNISSKTFIFDLNGSKISSCKLKVNFPRDENVPYTSSSAFYTIYTFLRSFSGNPNQSCHNERADHTSCRNQFPLSPIHWKPYSGANRSRVKASDTSMNPVVS